MWVMVILSGKVGLKDLLRAVCVSLLRIDGSSRHVWNHGVTATPWVLRSAENVILWCWLWEPDITTVSAKVSRLECLGDILLDNDSAASGVDEPRTFLHLGDELLVEQAASLFVKWAVDCDDITLSEHLLEAVDSPASNLLLLLWAEWLVVEVQQLLAVECSEASQDTLANAADCDGTDNLVLKIIFVLGDVGDVPVAALDLLVCWNEVTNEDKDGHDDVLSDGNNVGSGDLSDGDTAVCSVGGIKVDVVGPNTSCDCDLQLLRLGQALLGEISWMESAMMLETRRTTETSETNGVVMITSASTSSWSNLEFSPSLSDVVTKVWP